MKQNQKWTEPKIKLGSPSYVWFRYLDEDTGKMKLVIKKGSSNVSSLKSREKIQLLKTLQGLLLQQLKNGWNPLTNKIESEDAKDQQIDQLHLMTFAEALNFAWQKKLPDWSDKSARDYKSTKKYLIEAAAGLLLSQKKVVELRRPHYISILEEVVKKRGLGAKGYNKYREHLSTFIGKIEEYEVIEYNPIEKIKTKVEIKSNAHRPPTEEERKLIVNHIRTVDKNFYRFICVLYGCTLRPLEILHLQIKDLDLYRQCFILTPEEKKAGQEYDNKTKTNIFREVPIPNWLMDIFTKEMYLQKLPADYYIFGQTTKGKFMPGSKKLGRNAATYRWHQIVKIGLTLEVDLYGLKKLAGNDMVKLQMEQGVNDLLALPQRQMGHTSSRMTKVYVDEHTKVIDRVIRERMPRL